MRVMEPQPGCQGTAVCVSVCSICVWGEDVCVWGGYMYVWGYMYRVWSTCVYACGGCGCVVYVCGLWVGCGCMHVCVCRVCVFSKKSET